MAGQPTFAVHISLTLRPKSVYSNLAEELLKKVKEVLTGLMVALGRLIKGTYRITARHTYRERVLASTGRDPLRCVRCGRHIMLWQVWHPRYGVVYDELQAI